MSSTAASGTRRTLLPHLPIAARIFVVMTLVFIGFGLLVDAVTPISANVIYAMVVADIAAAAVAALGTHRAERRRAERARARAWATALEYQSGMHR